MPILGILASQISGRLWAPGQNFESIATTTVGAGGVSSITFSSIPSTYTHLQIRAISRSAGSTANRVNLNINGDTTTSAYWHLIYGTGSGAAAYTISTAYLQVASQSVSSDAASIFGTMVVDVLDYANTNKNKTVRTLGGTDLNGSGLITLYSGAQFSTGAITSLTFTPNAAENFAQYSSFALYGIRGN